MVSPEVSPDFEETRYNILLAAPVLKSALENRHTSYSFTLRHMIQTILEAIFIEVK